MGREGWEDVWTGKKRERMRGMNVKKDGSVKIERTERRVVGVMERTEYKTDG